MIVDPSISFGNIVTMVFGAVVWIITLAVAWTKFGGRLDMLAYKISLLEKAAEDIAEILKKFSANETDVLLLKREVAALQSDYAELNRTVEDLRRGNGWIQNPRREAINGEYPRST